MSSSSLAYFNSFTLEEKQNKIPGDNYRVKLSPDKGKGVAISPGSEKPRQKPFWGLLAKETPCEIAGENIQEEDCSLPETLLYIKSSKHKAKPKLKALNQV